MSRNRYIRRKVVINLNSETKSIILGTLTSILLITTSIFTVTRCNGSKERAERLDSGFYCKYCHKGVAYDKVKHGPKAHKNSKNRIEVVEMLKYKPCTSSKDSLHHIVWYRHNPDTSIHYYVK